MTESQIVARGCGIGVGAAREGSDNYLGEDGGPDGLNLLDLGGTEDGLDLVGLNEDSRSVTNFAERLLSPVGSRLLVVFPPKPTSDIVMKLQVRSSSLHESTNFNGIWDTYGDLNTVIGQDEGGVRDGELSGRHVDGWTGCLEEIWGWERRRQENANDRHPNHAPLCGKKPSLRAWTNRVSSFPSS